MEHFVMVKSSVHQEDVIVKNVYAPNKSVLNYMKQKLMEIKEIIDKLIIIVGDFKPLLLQSSE